MVPASFISDVLFGWSAVLQSRSWRRWRGVIGDGRIGGNAGCDRGQMEVDFSGVLRRGFRIWAEGESWRLKQGGRRRHLGRTVDAGRDMVYEDVHILERDLIGSDSSCCFIAVLRSFDCWTN